MTATATSESVVRQVGVIVGDFEQRLRQENARLLAQVKEYQRRLAEADKERCLQIAMKDRQHRAEMADVLGDNVNLDLKLSQKDALLEAYKQEAQSLSKQKS